MTTSNLSKIKPKLRTEGRVSGNFGRNKVKAGSSIQSLGVTKVSVVNVVKPDDYLNRLYEAYNKTTDPKLKDFIYNQIRDILVQRGQWNSTTKP
jgi:hypothetical protein